MILRTLLLISVIAATAVYGDETPGNAAKVKAIFRTRCVECHGETRTEAGLNVLDLSTYVGDDGYVIAGDVDGSHLFDTIVSDDEEMRMPKSPLPALARDEIEAIRQWIAQGAKAFPDDVATESATDKSVIGTEYILQKIVEFTRAIPKGQRGNYRFFSSNHMLITGATAAELKVQSHALAKSINHLSSSAKIVRPVSIDSPVDSVFAVDIRKLGWTVRPYHKIKDGKATQVSRFNLYDQVLLEYPYATVLQSSEIYEELAEEYFSCAELVRPVPFVRVDWFASIATQHPVYEGMLQLPLTLQELERELDIRADKNADKSGAQRAGMTVSGVSQNNRVVERHLTQYGSYWKSFDFKTSRGQQNMFIDPIDFHFAGGEMIWTLPNGLQAYLITDNLGNRINEAPTAIVTDKFAADRVVRNGLACMRCHERGMKRFVDNIRPAFEALPDNSHSSRAEVLELYVSREVMDANLKEDETRFLSAMEEVLDEPQGEDPLTSVSRKFLDAPITLSQAAGELGLRDASVLSQLFRLPEFTQLGLAGVSAGGVVRRDTWEDYYDRIVEKLGQGVSIAAVDGLTRPDYLSNSLSSSITLKTNKSGNTFSPGEELVIFVENLTGQDQFIELIGTDAKGAKSVLTEMLLLKNGQEYRFPEDGAIKIQPQLGKEFVTVYASPQRFVPGVLLRGDRVADRFVHDYYRLTESSVESLPTGLVKKTISIETK